jgi:hypothetical protein
MIHRGISGCVEGGDKRLIEIAYHGRHETALLGYSRDGDSSKISQVRQSFYWLHKLASGTPPSRWDPSSPSFIRRYRGSAPRLCEVDQQVPHIVSCLLEVLCEPLADDLS